MDPVHIALGSLESLVRDARKAADEHGYKEPKIQIEYSFLSGLRAVVYDAEGDESDWVKIR